LSTHSPSWNEAIPSARQYAIHLPGPLHDQFGEIPYDGAEFSFAAPAPILSMEPRDGANISADFESVKITFSEAVDKVSVQNAFQINPLIYGHSSWSTSANGKFEDVLTFLPNTLFEKGQ